MLSKIIDKEICEDFANFENSKSLVGPEVLVRQNVPPKAACVTESLGFCQIGLAPPEFLSILEKGPTVLSIPGDVAAAESVGEPVDIIIPAAPVFRLLGGNGDGRGGRCVGFRGGIGR